MFKKYQLLLLLLASLMMLVACGGSEEEPTTDTNETETSETNNTEPAEEDPTADFVSFSDETAGVSLKHPADWVIEAESGAVMLASNQAIIDDSDAEGAIVNITTVELEMLTFINEEVDTSDAVSVLATFANLMGGEGEDAMMTMDGDPTTVTIGSYDGAQQAFTGTNEDGTEILGNITAVIVDNSAFIILSGGDQASYDTHKANMDAILSSLELSAPAAMEEPMEEEEPVEEATDPEEELDGPVVVEPTEEELADTEVDIEAMMGNIMNAGMIVASLPPADAGLESGDYMYTNGNIGRDVAIYGERLWMASTGGLVAFDLASGEATKYTTLNGLPDIGIFSLETCPVAGAERLIIGSRKGLLLYNDETDGFDSSEALGFNEPTDVHDMVCDAANGRLIFEYSDIAILDLASGELTVYEEDADGLAWFTQDRFSVTGQDVWAPTGYSGVSRINADGTVTLYDEASGNLPDDDVTDVAIAPDGTIWFAASDGLFQLNANGEFTTFDRDNASDVISYFGPDQIEFLPNGDLWLVFSSSLCLLDPATSSCTVQYDYEALGLTDGGSIDDVVFSENGPIAFNTYYYGAGYFDGTQWVRYQLENQTPSNFFDGFFQDSEGNLWTLGEGIYKTDITASTWEQLEGVYGGADMAMDSQGNMWFVGGRNIYQYNGIAATQYDVDNSGIMDASHYAVAITPEDVVYAGGDSGYTIIDGATVTTVTEDADGWPFGNFRDMIYVNGTVYGATTEGLVSLDGNSWDILVDENTAVNILTNANFSSIDALPDGTLVLGSSTGIYYYADGQLSKEEAVTGSVSDIFVNAEGHIWAVAFHSGTFFGSGGNEDGGLYSFDGSDWRLRPLGDGFPMDSLRAVHVDNAGTIWIGTGDTGLGGGIMRIVP